MILYFRITKKQKEALLTVSPSIKDWVNRAIEKATEEITNENLFITDEDLKEYEERRALNGEGPHRRHKCTQATKDKIRKALKGRDTGWKHFPETKEAIRLANIGKHSGKRSEEAKLKMSLAKKGKELTEEHKRNIGLGHKGKKYKVKEIS